MVTAPSFARAVARVCWCGSTRGSWSGRTNCGSCFSVAAPVMVCLAGEFSALPFNVFGPQLRLFFRRRITAG